MARVGDILKVRNGYAFKTSDYKAEGVPLIRQTNCAMMSWTSQNQNVLIRVFSTNFQASSFATATC